MLRSRLALLAVAMAAGVAGCTFCDTCDDFPTPCVGGNCGEPGTSPVGGNYVAMPNSSDGPMASAPPTLLPPTPIVATSGSAPAGPERTQASLSAPAVVAEPPAEITPPPPTSVGSLPAPPRS